MSNLFVERKRFLVAASFSISVKKLDCDVCTRSWTGLSHMIVSIKQQWPEQLASLGQLLETLLRPQRDRFQTLKAIFRLTGKWNWSNLVNNFSLHPFTSKSTNLQIKDSQWSCYSHIIACIYFQAFSLQSCSAPLIFTLSNSFLLMPFSSSANLVTRINYFQTVHILRTDLHWIQLRTDLKAISDFGSFGSNFRLYLPRKHFKINPPSFAPFCNLWIDTV